MIVFNDHDHSYINQNTNNKYTSVTTLVKKYETKKDWYKIAEKYAKDNGQTAAYWLRLWEENKNRAGNSGTIYHKKQEQLITQGYDYNGVKVFGNNSYLSRDSEYDNYSYKTSLSELEDGVYPELLVWNNEFEIAGQVDVAIIKTFNNRRYIYIDDYKTNKEIKMTSDYKDKRTGRMRRGSNMLPPISHLQDCNYIHYNLQLSIYMYFLECFGFTPAKMRILSRPQQRNAKGDYLFDEEGIPIVDESKARDIYLPYLKAEVTTLLKHHLKCL